MNHLSKIYQKLEDIRIQKNEVVQLQHFEKAAHLRDQEKQLLEEADRIEAEYRLNLSKSKYVQGMNCLKSLWLNVYRHDEQQISANQTQKFESGTDIGMLARELFPNGVLAVPSGHNPNAASADYTRELIEQGVTTIYEATFIYDRIVVAIDILDFKNGQWHAFEVKASNSIKPIYHTDAAIQFYVLKHMPFQTPIDINIIHFNSHYVRKGDLNLEQLFFIQNLTTEAQNLQTDILSNTRKLKLTLLGLEPVIEMGKQCKNPYPCPFTHYCMQQIPKKEESGDEGQIDEPVVDIPAIRQFVAESKYGVGFLDFESIMPAIPMFDESRPYQQIVFQYSLHKQEYHDSEIEHLEHLADAHHDPRIQIIPSLIEHTRELQTIFVYNIVFEQSRIREMMRDFPEYADELRQLDLKLKDLMPVFRYHYRTKSMGGQYGIKTVLPIVCPDLSYSELEINQGQAASDAFLALYEEKDPTIIHTTRQHLIKYCTLDTYAMVRLWEVLKGLVNKKSKS
ncbi:MAG: DUF2779 domain-containing protein [Chitinophagaceae bacterium]|nr:DUF2779 domain-containing protein [Chitinophagaceae bacterium]